VNVQKFSYIFIIIIIIVLHSPKFILRRLFIEKVLGFVKPLTSCRNGSARLSSAIGLQRLSYLISDQRIYP
jgi:hypothetical protein